MKVTPRHEKFVDTVALSPIHIIATVKGKDSYEVEKDEKGKVNVKKIGVGGKTREGSEYNYTLTFLIDQATHLSTVQKDNTHIFDYDTVTLLTEDYGRRIIQWANSSDVPATPRELPKPESPSESNELEEKKETLASLIKALTEAGVARESIVEVVKAHHSVNGKPSANYNTVKDVSVLNDIISELEKLSGGNE